MDMRLIIMGPPGAGKGTWARVISEIYGIVVITTGDLLREAVAKDTEEGRIAGAHIKRGDLVPDEIVIKIVAERISAPDCAKGFILDGFPRTLIQAAALDSLLQSQGKQIDAVIEIKVDDAILIDRISGRYMCADCGASYHDTNHKPKVPGVCDRCGSTQFTRRKDDNTETVRNRLMAYYRETAPLIGYYFAKGRLRSVDGMAPIPEVASQIEAVLAKC